MKKDNERSERCVPCSENCLECSEFYIFDETELKCIPESKNLSFDLKRFSKRRSQIEIMFSEPIKKVKFEVMNVDISPQNRYHMSTSLY
jgi:hypothetical protein